MLSDFHIRHSKILYDSYFKVTGQKLTERFITEEDLAEKLYQAPFILLSHGTQPNPIFNYANLAAQKLWQMDWNAFIQLPSRLSAEPVETAERQAMLNEARIKGYISNYNGVRISSSGQRFIIENATLWNFYDHSGTYQGQAATFKSWQYI